ncbi:MAG: dehydrogenase [Acidobacteria bacterium]|nr:dehydrogenase [Acidobacteriota bacterium]
MARQFRVGVTPDFQTQAQGLLEPALAEVLPGVEWEFMPDTGAAPRADVLDGYDAVIALSLYFPAESLAGVRRLAVIARWGVGYDRIDVPACTAADVILAITPEAVRRPVAEGIFTLIFALAKNLLTLDSLCRAGRWRDRMPRNSQNVEGKTLGSVGAGNIAGEMFRMARALGFARLLAYDPLIPTAPEGVALASLETVMRESDFVAVNCPLSEQTRNLIGARELAWMKPAAYLINTARGPIVNQEALVEALRGRRIAGAGLDVFETEPVPPDNPLLQMDNVIVAPHSIAWTQESFRDNSLYACRNVLAVSQGQAPKHVVNREVLERPGCRAKLRSWKVDRGS